MLGKTHVAVGLATYVATTKSFHPAELAVVAATSTLPDIDFHFGHRGVTHSLFALVLLAYIVKTTYPALLIPVLIGYGSHLILDTLTPMGIPWLWPKNKRYKIPLVQTGSTKESIIKYFAFLILVILAIKKAMG